MGFLSKLFSGGDHSEVVNLIADGALLIDARSPAEFAQGHVEGAINIPHELIAQQIGGHEADKTRNIVVYCLSGARSGMAVARLKHAGYANVVNGGGIKKLRGALAS